MGVHFFANFYFFGYYLALRIPRVGYTFALLALWRVAVVAVAIYHDWMDGMGWMIGTGWGLCFWVDGALGDSEHTILVHIA